MNTTTKKPIIKHADIKAINLSTAPITNEYEVMLRDKLKELGLSPSLIGYEYLVSCVLLCMEHPTMRFAVTSELYPSIAATFGTTKSAVERGIRHCIQEAFAYQDIRELYDLCKGCVPANRGTLTNRGMIAVLIEWLRVQAGYRTPAAAK